MKIILSRKGFDSSYGGYPSIVLPTSEMITLPIPSVNDDIAYSILQSSSAESVYDIMKSLSSNIKVGKKYPLTDTTTCHLDPDLLYNSVDRLDGWRGAFGQIGAAQKVLENNDVKEGDLFLFFGWFNDVEENLNGYKFKKGSGRHTMFGYLQVGKVLYTKQSEVPEWLKKHPHASESRCNTDSNCIYIARETCSFNSNIKGYGMFKYSEQLDLTKKGMTRTCWELPEFFKGLTITYHNESSWKNGYFKSACRGQEFVVQEDDSVEKWAIELVENYSTNRVV